jgi:hypothetical protein
VARKSPQRPNAEEPQASSDELDEQASDSDIAADDAPARAETDDPADGPTGDRSLWTDADVDPIEIALPSGVGYTLRAYRMSNALPPTDIEGREEDEDPFAARVADDEEVVILDEEFAALAGDEEDEEEDKTPARGKRRDADETGESEESEDEPADADEEAHEDEEDEAAAEEVPFFLTHRGRLLIFKSPESLVAFVRSGAPHDLADLDTWSVIADRIQPADVSATDDDSYELDLVVENLRGGHDTWDLDLLIRAGEISRDLGYALRLVPVLTALSPGSPLDDLDEALRSAAGGGIGGFMGRRRLRRIGAQQASLGWRTIIGKISAAVDWRD